jgi:hypothetical protein
MPGMLDDRRAGPGMLSGLLDWLSGSANAAVPPPQQPAPPPGMPEWMQNLPPEEAAHAMAMMAEARRREPLPPSQPGNMHDVLRTNIQPQVPVNWPQGLLR